MHERHNRNNTKNHNTRYNVVHPQCRGYVHKIVFYSTLYKKITVLICALSCRSLQVLKAAHTAAEVIHAHSWDLTFSYKIALASHQFILHQKA